MKLKCPISNCQWRYESCFAMDHSFQIIVMHIECEHRKICSVNIVKSALPSVERKRHNQTTQPASGKIPCPSCKQPFQEYNGENLKAFKVCLNCFRNSRKKRKIHPQRAVAINISTNNNTVSLCNETVDSHLDHNHKDCPSYQNYHSDSSDKRSGSTIRDHPRATFRLRPIGVHDDHVVTVVGIAD